MVTAARRGHTVAVFGAGPVGLFAAHSAMLRGVARFFLVDVHPDRLRLGEEYGATSIAFSQGDPVEQILVANGRTVDRGVDAVGWQTHDPQGDEHPELILDNLVKVVRTTGVIGVYVPEDPKNANESAQEGRIGWDYGTFFTKGQRMGTGQCPVKRYNRELRGLIISGRADPGRIG